MYKINILKCSRFCYRLFWVGPQLGSPAQCHRSQWTSSIEKSMKVLFLIKVWKGTRLCSRMLSPTAVGAALFPSEPGRRWPFLRAGVAALLNLQIQRPVQPPHAARCRHSESRCCVCALHQRFWSEGPGSRSLHAGHLMSKELAQAQRKRGNKSVSSFFIQILF